ncbi:divergent PAP2 family protein [Acetanaerobacterium sp. MSJ-12]|uniref:Divergent PAP2 family protein n=1 Tax=Bittarella massiliensis (ex Durand et al. 2017) TaxID=1720313 RepID=A0AAW5KDA5_9FIRM|nr:MULTISPECIES: divergent PAP2 family protein [Oscillospiraceae]MBU5419406.1 divergent PAP2 family protein [Acetanaerobacterium sp. MSJ-12]MCQ4948929.1 divergent PAP2 family protein [Bittarella massiliensis (ex Durand et al. 2017)]
MDILRQMFGNYCLNVALISWLSAQLLKTIFTFIATKKLNLERMVGAGGMPSAHSALVCSLTVAIARTVGVSSPEFALAFLVACVVMYDAMGVRRSAGEQAKVLNKIIFTWEKSQDAPDEDEDDMFKKDLKESLGHTPLEVLGGALLGILVAMLVSLT